MLEKEVIQYRGFRNTYDENGNPNGFEFRMRTTYYRGLWLSQLRVGSVYIDGERILPDSGDITWIIEGKEYTPAEMAEDNVDFWPMNKPVIVRVKKAGGLKQGYHDVWCTWGFSSSYMPPDMDQFKDEVDPKGFSMGGNPTKKRRMLIV